jgi:hypothetical protein
MHRIRVPVHHSCQAVSAAGTSEQDCTRITYDVALAAAQVLARLSPGMTFI